MNLTITPVKLSGTVTPPPSKSQAHRLLICAALAGEGSVIHNLADSQDIRATRRCLAELTADRRTLPELDCGESGSTLRVFVPQPHSHRGRGILHRAGAPHGTPEEAQLRHF